MLSTNQKKQTGSGFALTAGFWDINNLNETETDFAFLSTEEVGPPTDPSVTAPVIYGSQSTTFGARTVILGSTNIPGSYILPANIGYRLNPADFRDLNLELIGGETIDLGELRNRSSGTQSFRLYGSITPYVLSFIRYTAAGEGGVGNNTYIKVFPSLGPYSVDNIVGLPSQKVAATDHWGGRGYLFKNPDNDFSMTLRRPNNNFPNVARYLFSGLGTSPTGGVNVHTWESINPVFGGWPYVIVTSGEFKLSGYGRTTWAEENSAIDSYNAQYGTSIARIYALNSVYQVDWYFMGGIIDKITANP